MGEFALHPQQPTMSRILEVRYTDPAAEKRLCRELLLWAKNEDDTYALSFARTYLGDYYIARNDTSLALFHLGRAREAMDGQDWPELRTRLLFLTAISYDLDSDDQNAVSHYLEALSLARLIGDITSESMVLNNIGYLLQRHGCFEDALGYYRQAQQIYSEEDHPLFTTQVLYNLAEVLLELGRLDSAREHMETCEKLIADHKELMNLQSRIRCRYHTARGEKGPALEWARWTLEHQEHYEADLMEAFDNYRIFCICMLTLGNQEYSRRFLELMERFSNGRPAHLKPLAALRMEYTLRFLSQYEHAAAYHNYYRLTSDLRKLADQSIVAAMSAKIALDSALVQTEDARTAQENLARQANLDELTQLYNRRYLDRLLLEQNHSGDLLTIIMVDVDYFKEYNDFYGHIKGDEILRAIASCLRENISGVIHPCRYGGDEFTCVCIGMDDAQVESYIRAVCADLAARALPHERSRCAQAVTLSLGWASGTTDGLRDPALLLQLADQALYEAKVSGRNTCRRKRQVGNDG